MKHFIALFIILLALNGFTQTPGASKWSANGKVKSMVNHGDTLMMAGEFSFLGIRTGGIARVNKQTGVMDSNFPTVSGFVKSIVKDGTGGYYIGGFFDRVNGEYRKNIAHINADYTLDSWAPIIDTMVNDIIVRQNTLLISGVFRKINGITHRYIAEIDKTTGDPTSFDLGITQTTNGLGFSRMLRFGSKIYVLTNELNIVINNLTHKGFIQLSTDSLKLFAPQSHFYEGTNGCRVTTVIPWKNSVIFCGEFVTSQSSRNIFRLDTLNIGLPYPIFAIDNSYQKLTSAAVINNSLYVSGIFNFPRPYAAKFNLLNNSYDTSWVPNIGFNQYFTSVDESIIVPQGTTILKIDSSFGGINTDCKAGMDNYSSVMNVIDDGTHYIVVGKYELTNGLRRTCFAAIDSQTDSILPLTISPSTGNNVWGNIMLNTLAMDKHFVYVGGTFGTISANGGSSANRYCMAKINTLTGTVDVWNPGLGGSCCCSTPYISNIEAFNKKVFFSGSITSVLSSSSYYGYAINSSASTASSYKCYAGGGAYTSGCNDRHPIFGRMPIKQGIMIWGNFTTINGQNVLNKNLAITDSLTGNVIPIFLRLNSNAVVYDAKFWNDKLIICGKIDSVSGRANKNIAIIDTTSWRLYPIELNADSTVESIEVYQNKLFMFGAFTKVNGEMRSGIAVFDLNTMQLESWDPNNADLNSSSYYVYNDEYRASHLLNNKLYLGSSKKYLGFDYAPYFNSWSLTPSNYFTVKGNVFNDKNLNCTFNTGDKGLSSILLKATPGPFYTSTYYNGEYNLDLPIGSYNIQQLFLPDYVEIIGTQCNSDVIISSLQPNTIISNVNFADTVSNCYFLDLAISSTGRIRCFKTKSVILYKNIGYEDATNIVLKIAIGNQFTPINSVPTWSSYTNDTIYYNLANIPGRTSGYITLTDSNHCDFAAIGTTQCITAIISPGSQCMPSGTTSNGSWDKSSIKVKGSCAGDSARFVIINSGSGDMNFYSEFRVYFDNVLGYTGQFKLNSGDSLIVMVYTGGMTIRLEADQHSLHPGNSLPRATVEECNPNLYPNGITGVRVGMPISTPIDDNDPEVATECVIVRGSYDPNDKQSLPIGIGEEKIILPNQNIKYTIRFQNTGTAETFFIKITDTLDANLDPSTIVFGSTSHKANVKVSGYQVPVIIWDLPDASLVPASQDTLLSQGFVSFTIKPYSNVAIGTEFHNTAGIYFDYNPPIITNTLTLKLDEWNETDTILGAHIKVYEFITKTNSVAKESHLKLYPNPAKNSVTIEGINVNNSNKILITSYDGKIVECKHTIQGNKITLNTSNLAKGVYIIKLESAKTNANLLFVIE